MSNDPAARISRIEAELVALTSEMTTEADRWQAAAIDWLHAVYDDDVARAIKKHSDQVKKLARTAALSELKANVAEVRATTHDVVKSTFSGNVEFWAHIGGDLFLSGSSGSFSIRYDKRRTSKAPRDEPLRVLRGRVLSLLSQAGMAEDRGLGGESRTAPGFRYPYALQESDEMKKHTDTYAAAYSRYVDLCIEREDIIRANDEANAEDLWSNA